MAISQEHFVAYASHEIRTPLTIVKGVLETSFAYDQSLDEACQSMAKALLRLEDAINLANSLLHLAEVEGLQMTTFREDVNVIDTILDTISYFEEKHHDQYIELQLTDNFTENTAAIRILGNSMLLGTVLNNILENASKYSQQQPVELNVDYDSESVVIKVIDHGIGIPFTQLDDIFLPLMRASNVGDIPGFGLGLTIAKKIIDMHQGELAVCSANDHGTTVSIRLLASLLS